MLQYRFARKADIPAIYTIWQEAFPADSTADITAFLERVDLSAECLLALEDNEPISMVFMLPATLPTKAMTYRLQYIYAAATRKAFRGRGVFGALLQAALEVAKERGCHGSFLRPAQPSLFEYYTRFGYQPFFYCRTLRGQSANGNVSAALVTAQAYASLRSRFVQTTVEWEPRFVEYSMGEAVLLEDKGCALYSKRGNTLFLYELLGPVKNYEAICAALAKKQGCEEYLCRVPAGNNGECFGLLKPFTTIQMPPDTIPFMGLALD